MPRAFQSKAFFSSEADRIVEDGDSTTLKGVAILEVGKMAVFQSKQPDGTMKLRQVMISPEHVSAILSHAAPVTPSHWTHDYHGKNDPLSAQIGGISNVRRDGNRVVGDLMLAPTEYKAQAVWNAKMMPQNMMLSPVFDFNPSDPKCIPTSFDAADLVEAGAGVTALWTALLAESETPKSSSMTIEELTQLCEDPKAKEVLRGALKGHDSAEADMEDAAADGAESAAGVMEEDKKDEDKQAPALMSAVTKKVRGARLALACFRINKATARLSKKSLTEEQVKVLVKAAAQGSIGNNTALMSSFPSIQLDATPATAFMSRLKVQLDAGASEGTAIGRARKDAFSAGKSKEVEEWEKAGRPLPQKAA
jgi:hypothetical protein